MCNVSILNFVHIQHKYTALCYMNVYVHVCTRSEFKESIIGLWLDTTKETWSHLVAHYLLLVILVGFPQSNLQCNDIPFFA